jgi:hypothetical protein
MKRNTIEYRFLFDGRSPDGWCMAGLGRFMSMSKAIIWHCKQSHF